MPKLKPIIFLAKIIRTASKFTVLNKYRWKGLSNIAAPHPQNKNKNIKTIQLKAIIIPIREVSKQKIITKRQLPKV